MPAIRLIDRTCLKSRLPTVLGLLGLCALVLLLQACLGSSDTPCSEVNPCLEGACDPAGVCVPAAPLGLVNQRLADGALGLPYRDELRAEGGLPPYSFSLLEAPAWMSLEPATGLITGTPDEPCRGGTVRVAVRDGSFGSGRTEQVGLPLDVAGCVGGQLQACFLEADGRCLLGARACPDGLWGECEGGAASIDPAHCGPACAPCDTARADRCSAGLCACGEGGPCTGGDACCAGACTRLEDDPGHCGGCGRDCGQRLLHAQGPVCDQGRCDYGACEPGFLDCDGARENGCETAEGLEQCGACGTSCRAEVLGAAGAACAFSPEGDRLCDYESCLPGSLDCDGERGNGCETARSHRQCASCADDCLDGAHDGLRCLQLGGPDFSTGGWRCGCADADDCDQGGGARQCCDGACRALDDPQHCGACGHSCLTDPAAAGPRCLDPARGECGCLQDADCGPLGLCCQNACVPRDDGQCLACGQACTIADGGPTCAPEDGTCACGADEECNDWPGGEQSCRGTLGAHRCACGAGGGACQGGPGSQCCHALGDLLACTDVRTDADNCGRCGVACAPGMACEAGGCACDRFAGVGCPLEGAGTHCLLERCVCPSFDNGSACRDGRLCCDGEQGGQGGPEAGPDLGCCLAPCGQNEPGGCVQAYVLP